MKISFVFASLFSATLAVETLKATPVVTSSNSKFGGGIEGLAVDSTGSIFAVNYNGQQAAIGQAVPSQKLMYQDKANPTSLFNGIRFSTDCSGNEQAFVADAINHRVVRLSDRTSAGFRNATVFCQDPGMLQPNDIAIAPSSGRVFLSGMNYQATTKVGDGDLWTCDKNGKAAKLGQFQRTNGIEVSPDEKTLYLSESTNKGGAVISNIIYAFDLNSKAGQISNKRVFADFGKLDKSAAIDIDGMRTDTQGNLYVARNGNGKVAKLSPSGKLLAYINVPGIMSVGNLEFGGKSGTDLYIGGKCEKDAKKGCVSVYKGKAAGRAFNDLQRHSKGSTAPTASA